MDTLTKAQRSHCMSRIKSKNTQLETLFMGKVRSFRLKGYLLHCNLPGKPDIYFQRARLAVFVDGCFWHGCPRCYSRPATNKDFWTAKIKKNRRRDATVNRQLRNEGIRIVRFWGHQIKASPDRCAEKMRSYLLKSPGTNSRKPSLAVRYK
jgi:DNA mismatch endonuclease (patch repair protein)